MEQCKPNLGELAGEDARRDAVHIAVAPVTAGQKLKRGQRVGIRADGKAVLFTRRDREVGIVDPFLEEEDVEEEQSFWLFLFPNTITDLRHVWSHPAFKAKVPASKGEEQS